MNQLGTFKSMRNHVFIFLGLILAQFWLGMTINLEVVLPTLHYSGLSALLFYSVHFWQVLAHIVLAIIVLTVSVRFLMLSFGTQSRVLQIIGIIGLVAIVSAIFNGIEFLLSGQFFGNSIGMAMSGVSAVVTYAVALYFLGSIFSENVAPRI
jgi:hypothetical protein